MSKFSNYLEDALVDATLRGIPYSPAPTVYLGLYVSSPEDDNSGTEVSGGGYARLPITFSAPSNGFTANTNQLIFPVATSAWGTVTHFGILDSGAAGNLLYYGQLIQPREVSTGDLLKFLPGTVTVNLL